MKIIKFIFCILSISIILSGCATQKTITQEEAKGREIPIFATEKGQKEAFTFSFEKDNINYSFLLIATNDGEKTKLQILGPFAVRLATLTLKKDKFEYDYNDKFLNEEQRAFIEEVALALFEPTSVAENLKTNTSTFKKTNLKHTYYYEDNINLPHKLRQTSDNISKVFEFENYDKDNLPNKITISAKLGLFTIILERIPKTETKEKGTTLQTFSRSNVTAL